MTAWQRRGSRCSGNDTFPRVRPAQCREATVLPAPRSEGCHCPHGPDGSRGYDNEDPGARTPSPVRALPQGTALGARAGQLGPRFHRAEAPGPPRSPHGDTARLSLEAPKLPTARCPRCPATNPALPSLDVWPRRERNTPVQASRCRGTR